MHYETDERVRLPEKLKIRLLLGRAQLNQSQLNLLQSWCAADPDDYNTIVGGLVSLDDPRWTSVPGSSRAMMVAEEWSEDQGDEAYFMEEPTLNMASAQVWYSGEAQTFWDDELQEELLWTNDDALDTVLEAQYQDTSHDIGEDSITSDVVYILESDLGLEHSEESLESSFAVFSQVKKELQAKRKARGWFPGNPSGKGKGKPKGKKGFHNSGKGKVMQKGKGNPFEW